MADLIAGAAVGAAFGELLKAVLEIKDKAINFGQTLTYLRTTLAAVAPTIKEMEMQNNDLGRPKEELESLIREMEEATKLVYNCSKISRLNFPARIRYQEQMGKMVESLVRFFVIDMQAHTARDMKETLIEVRRLRSAVNKLPFVVSSEDDVTGETELCSESLQPNHEAIEAESVDSESTQQPAEVAARSVSDEQIIMGDIDGLTRSVSQNSEAADKLMNLKCYNHERYINVHLNLSISLPKFKWKRGKFNDQVKKDDCESKEVISIKKPLILDKFDLEDLLSAWTEVLGATNHAITYKAILKDGTTLVMKRLRDVEVEKQVFEKRMEIVQRISQHPNILPLVAWFYDEKLLIYEYMPTGSFSLLLHGGAREDGWRPLDWDTRMKIALGVAKGIAHIHSIRSENRGKYSHSNLSSSNVLVTPHLQGRISDLALTYSVSGSFNLTHESDVYRFGILLLEMLTGKLPSECDHGFPSWVEFYIMEGILKDVLDDAIFTDNLQSHRRMLQLAMACVGSTERFWEPLNITSMVDVVVKMEDIIASESN